MPPTPGSGRRLDVAIAVSCVLWLGGVIAGMTTLWDYANHPGPPGEPPRHWPHECIVDRDRHHATLVMLAHPHCPCTRASIRELALLMRHAEPDLRAHVLFFKPDGAEANWEQTDLWRSADAIPGVQVHADADGLESRRFGAQTSGAVVVYDADGALLFSGGVTAARGHSGDNAGRSRILALLAGEEDVPPDSPVFGCPINDPLPSACEPANEQERGRDAVRPGQ